MALPKSKKAIQEVTIELEADGQYVSVEDKATALDTIFRNADIKHGLTIFGGHELAALDLWKKGEKYYLHCLIRKKKIFAKPEEAIRQLCIKRLLDLGYNADQLALEVPIKMGSTIHSKAADIVVYREAIFRQTPYLVVELKRPQRKDGIDQLESYMNATGVPFGMNNIGEKIRKTVEKAELASKDAKRLLAEAKKEVENLIENG